MCDERSFSTCSGFKEHASNSEIGIELVPSLPAERYNDRRIIYCRVAIAVTANASAAMGFVVDMTPVMGVNESGLPTISDNRSHKEGIVKRTMKNKSCSCLFGVVQYHM